LARNTATERKDSDDSEAKALCQEVSKGVLRFDVDFPNCNSL
jgi:hypothetical protein